MITSAGALSFVARHPLAAIVTAAGLLLAGLGYAQQGYELWQSGVEAWQLQAAGFLLFTGAIVVMLYRWDKERRSTASSDPSQEATRAAVGEIHNVTSHNQSGGIAAHTVNVGRRHRALSSSSANEFKRYVLTSLSRDVEWDIVSILGDQEAFAFAGEIYQFMKANGFKMQDAAAAQAVFIKPVEGICIEQNGKIVVGTNVNVPRSKR